MFMLRANHFSCVRLCVTSGLQLARLLCPDSATSWTAGLPCLSLSPGVLLKLMPIESVLPAKHLILCPFSSCLQSFPASGAFPMSQFFSSGGQSIGVSALASVLPMNIQDWFHLGLTGLISSQSKELSRTFSKYLNSKASILQCSAFFMVQLSHPHIIWHLCQQCYLSAF